MTYNEVSGHTEAEDDEEDGPGTHVHQRAGVRTRTGALHPHLQGPVGAVCDGASRAAPVMNHSLRLAVRRHWEQGRGHEVKIYDKYTREL